MSGQESSDKGVDMWSSLRCLGYLSSFNLLVAVCLGMYVRWEQTAESVIMVIFILGLFVSAIACILYYYFSMESASLSLFHLWFGFLQGLLCFLNSQSLENDIKEQVTNYLLLASVAVRMLWALTERLCSSATNKPVVLTSSELLELLGFGVASISLVFHKSLAMIALTFALTALIVDLRMKSPLALPNLACFAVITAITFFKSLEIQANPFALSCYLGRLICEPLLDVYFSSLSATERWKHFLSAGSLWRRFSLFPLAFVELAFFVLCAFKLGNLDVWYLVIPGFFVFGLLWILCHMVFLITLWCFHTKLGECQKTWAAQRSQTLNLDRIMASRGMRHFCLISERLVLFCLMSTIILGAVSWQASNGLFMSVLLVVLPLESLAHGLFHELGNCLGGTCVGYAVVVPTCYSRQPFLSTGGDCLRLQQILDMWKERNTSFSSRLILVLDTENSEPWVKAVQKVEKMYVAVQGAKMSPVQDAEAQEAPRLGDFTAEWVKYNCDPDSGMQWSERGRVISAIYGVSKPWSDYALHLPTGSDVAKHWKTHFPKATYPLVAVANWCCGLNLLWLCSACLRCVRRLKLSWFPPSILDTGQGIKLVRS
ncbi:transmembrane protein 168-A [Sinocyclocheilus grahami]|uniref:transmembrane protein 168-A n=1 Tax=Sinocyclocheilus grahami TaxID=75366 RepID=UPI0007AC9592|nr:PREDICTED: transmembrane protein 168-A [Sinocyclocheilus grahami]